jgi:hypothetical protein
MVAYIMLYVNSGILADILNWDLQYTRLSGQSCSV